MKYSYFRFSKVVKTADELLSWFEWFKFRGIACAIARYQYKYALFREGIEAIEYEPSGNSEKMGKIIKKFDPRGVF